MDLLTKTKTDGSQVIRKLSRDETRQIEKYKKMGREEKKLYAVKPRCNFLLIWFPWSAHALLKSSSFVQTINCY